MQPRNSVIQCVEGISHLNSPSVGTLAGAYTAYKGFSHGVHLLLFEMGLQANQSGTLIRQVNLLLKGIWKLFCQLVVCIWC
jgi:hypothetical protein